MYVYVCTTERERERKRERERERKREGERKREREKEKEKERKRDRKSTKVNNPSRSCTPNELSGPGNLNMCAVRDSFICVTSLTVGKFLHSHTARNICSYPHVTYSCVQFMNNSYVLLAYALLGLF